jgi:hypothetical protein
MLTFVAGSPGPMERAEHRQSVLQTLVLFVTFRDKPRTIFDN